MKKRISFLILAILMLTCVLSLVACGGNKGNDDIIGVYHSESVAGISSSVYKLTMKENKQYSMAVSVLSVDSAFSSGTYSRSGDNLTLKDSSNSSLTFSGTYKDDVISLTISGVSLTFKKSTGEEEGPGLGQVVVSFNTDGGTTIASQNVSIGGKATQPTSNPIKNGYNFDGWYKDTNKTQVFNFATEIILVNTTIYAKWEWNGSGEPPIQNNEYTIKFDVNYLFVYPDPTPANQITTDKKISTTTTPTRAGYDFMGWWISNGNEDFLETVYLVTKWTSNYVFEQNTTLYARWEEVTTSLTLRAPMPSVSGNTVSWDAVIGAVNYQLTITGPSGFDSISETLSPSTLTYSVPFSASPAGNYSITMRTVGNGDTTLTSVERSTVYKNKQLIAPNGYNYVRIQNRLLWQSVKNATSYDVYYTADWIFPTYTFLTKVTTNSVTLDELPEVRDYYIKVEAKAEGYLSAYSVYEYTAATLTAPTGFAFDNSTNKLSWLAVQNAVSYKIYYGESSLNTNTLIDEVETLFIILPNNIFDAKTYYVRVEACANGYVPVSGTYTLNNIRLKTPIISSISNSGLITWNSVADADKYEIDINGTVYSTTTTTYQMTLKNSDFMHTIKVRSIDSLAIKQNSTWSDATQIKELGIPSATIAADRISWPAISGATRYKILINGTDEQTITTTSFALPTTLTSTTYNIKIRAEADNAIYDSYSPQYDFVIYTVTFHPNNDSAETIKYVAKDAKVNFSNPWKTGYSFDKWYSNIGLSTAFDLNTAITSNTNLYAGYTVRSNNLSFNSNGGTGTVATMSSIAGGTSVTLPANGFTRSGFNFVGWGYDTGTYDTNYNTIYTIYQPGHTFTMPFSDSTVTLRAMWRNCTLVFNGNTSTSGTMSNVLLDNTFTITLPSCSYQKTGYSFAGWNTAANGSGTTYQAGTLYTMPESNNNTTLYAMWKANSYTITLNKQDGIDGSNSVSATYDDNMPYATAPTKSGAVFQGYFDAITGGKQYYSSTMVSMSKWDKDSTATLYARWASDTTGLQYTLNGSAYTVSGIGTATTATIIVIPSTYEGLPVTTIAANAFQDRTHIVEIYIPNSVTTIGSAAFRGCSNLEILSLPFIGNTRTATSSTGLFGYIFGTTSYTGGTSTSQYYTASSYSTYYIPTKLIDVRINDQSSISYGGFYNCANIRNIELPNNLTTITTSAFRGCTNLLAIRLPSGLLSIGDSTFYNCSSLVALFIPNSVTTITGTAVFTSCSRLTLYSEAASRPSGWNASWNTSRPMVWSAKEAIVGDLHFMMQGTEAFAVRYLGTSANVSIPKTITVSSTNYTVTQIGANMFYQNTALITITIPNTVKSIGDNAFYGSSSMQLRNVIFENGSTLETIGASAFYYCRSITNFAFSDTIKTIGDSAFYGCNSLTSIDLPNALTTIGASAFYDCSAIVSVTMGDNVTSIGANTFYGCSKLVSINLSAKLTTIGQYAFRGCSVLKSVFIPSSVTTVGFWAFYSNNNIVIYCGVASKPSGWDSSWYSGGTVYWNVLGSMVVNDMLFVIQTTGAVLMEYYGSASDVVIPKTITVGGNNYSVTEIGARVFYQNKDLRSATIPNTVKTIGEYAFYGYLNSYWWGYDCIPLSSINFESGSLLENIGAYAFYRCQSITTFAMPNTVKTIGQYAFSGCIGLTSIVLPNGITSIGNSAFSYCSELAQITIPNTLSDIGQSAFDDTAWLKNQTAEFVVVGDGVLVKYNQLEGERDIVIPSTIKIIGYEVFKDCKNITTITIPSSVTRIDFTAFPYAQIILIVQGATPAAIESGYFSSSIRAIIVPDAAVSTYKSTWGNNTWGNFTNIIYSQSSVTDNKYLVSNNMLIAYWGNDSSFTIPNGVTSIGNYAFSGRTNLTTVSIPNGVTSIGNYAFYGCEKLASISIPSTVTSIGESAFNETAIWNNATENSVIYADKWVVGYTGTLGVITLRSDTVGIANGAFWSSGITNITIPAAVKYIGNDAFRWSNSLATVTFADGSQLISIGSWAFNSTAITSIVIPNGTVSIGTYAFYDCRNLTSVTIPQSLTTMGSYVFYDCNSSLVIRVRGYTSRPSGWDSYWNRDNYTVTWNYTGA